MAHSRTWDETKPVGGVEAASTLDTIIQNFKTDVRERDRLEHNWNGAPSGPSTTYDGVHLEGSARILTGLLATLPANRGVTPIDGAGGNEDGRLFLSTDTGELLYSDGATWLTALKKISGFVPRTFAKKSGGDQTYSGVAETLITSLSAVTVPGTPNGVLKYELSIFLAFLFSAGSLTIRVHMGNAGGVGDATILTYQPPTAIATQQWFVVPDFEITPAAADKITITVQNTSGGATNTIFGSGTTVSWLVMKQVIA